MRTEDGYIIHKCLNGDSGAFGILVDKYKAGIYALAYSRLGNLHDAEDAAQEAFIKVYENLHKLKHWESFASWLYRIATNVCNQRMRTASRIPDHEPIGDNNKHIFDRHSIESYNDQRVFESLHEALDTLPEMHRQVVALRYLGGMSSFEIARFSGVSPSAVRKRLSKARKLLKAEMLTAMGTAFEKQKLSANFTLRITELVKRIRIHPLPKMTAIPWGISLAVGVLVAAMGIAANRSLPNLTIRYYTASATAGQGTISSIDTGYKEVELFTADLAGSNGKKEALRILGTYDLSTPDGYHTHAIAHDGRNMYTAASDSWISKIYKHRIDNLSSKKLWAVLDNEHFYLYSLAVKDGVLWAGEHGRELMLEFDMRTHLLRNIYNAGNKDGPSGIVWDGIQWWSIGDSGDIQRHKNDSTLSVAESWAFLGRIEVMLGLAWDGSNLWGIGTPFGGYGRSYLCKFDYNADSDQVTICDSYQVPSGTTGLTWDGKNFWLTHPDSDKIYKIAIEPSNAG